MSNALTLGHELQAARRARHLTQAEAAGKADVSVGTWSRTESGLRIPEVKNIVAMAHAVGMAPRTLAAVGQPAAAEKLAAILAGTLPRAATTVTEGIAIAVDTVQMFKAAGWDTSVHQTDHDGTTVLVIEATRRDDALSQVPPTG